jgi:hypothetical protein
MCVRSKRNCESFGLLFEHGKASKEYGSSGKTRSVQFKEIPKLASLKKKKTNYSIFGNLHAIWVLKIEAFVI